MKRVLFAGAALLTAALLPAGAGAQETIKIGVINSYSGQFADTGAQIDNGIKLYMKQHGDKVAGKKIEIIRKDTGGPNPDVAKRLAQELIVRDKADIIAGFTLTPEALGASGVATEAKKFMVVMNAATSVVTEKSPYIVRVSLTLPQIGETLGTWAATKGKVKKAYTMVTDYGPGIDAEQAFQRAFKAAGGEIVGSVRMPIAIRISRLSCNARRISTRNRSSFSCRAARSRQLSARLSPSAAWTQEDQDDEHRGGGGRNRGEEPRRSRPRPHQRMALRLQS